MDDVDVFGPNSPNPPTSPKESLLLPLLPPLFLSPSLSQSSPSPSFSSAPAFPTTGIGDNSNGGLNIIPLTILSSTATGTIGSSLNTAPGGCFPSNSPSVTDLGLAAAFPRLDPGREDVRFFVSIKVSWLMKCKGPREDNARDSRELATPPTPPSPPPMKPPWTLVCV